MMNIKRKRIRLKIFIKKIADRAVPEIVLPVQSYVVFVQVRNVFYYDFQNMKELKRTFL